MYLLTGTDSRPGGSVILSNVSKKNFFEKKSFKCLVFLKDSMMQVLSPWTANSLGQPCHMEVFCKSSEMTLTSRFWVWEHFGNAFLGQVHIYDGEGQTPDLLCAELCANSLFYQRWKTSWKLWWISCSMALLAWPGTLYTSSKILWFGSCMNVVDFLNVILVFRRIPCMCWKKS